MLPFRPAYIYIYAYAKALHLKRPISIDSDGKEHTKKKKVAFERNVKKFLATSGEQEHNAISRKWKYEPYCISASTLSWQSCCDCCVVTKSFQARLSGGTLK